MAINKLALQLASPHTSLLPVVATSHCVFHFLQLACFVAGSRCHVSVLPVVAIIVFHSIQQVCCVTDFPAMRPSCLL